MKKILIRSIIPIVFITLVIVILLRGTSPFGGKNSSFASDPKNEITRIEFGQNAKKLSLEKRGDTWFVNGKTGARKSGIMFILRILQEIQIKSPVSPGLFDKEITEKKVSPVTVKIYNNHRLIRSFLVFKTSSNLYGNIMKMRNSSKPFIVCIPGFEGDIGSGFTLNELFWQPYTVFNLLPSEIASVRFENFSDTSSSFSIINRNHQYSLSGSPNADPALVIRYASYFAYVPLESWAFDMEKEDQKKIEDQQPLFRISVITVAGHKSVLTLWPKKNDKNPDSDRLFGKTSDRDELFVMRYFDIDPLIKKRSYFIP